MSVPLDNTKQFITAKLPRKKPSITIEDDSIRAAQRRIAMATIFIPFIGTLIAMVLAWRNGVGTPEIGLLVSMYILTSLGIEFGFHRLLSHKAFETKPVIRILFAILGSMAAEGSVLYWVAGHRRHHVHSDTGNDPHSPHIRNLKSEDEPVGGIRGLWHSHIGWMMTDKVTNCTLFARDIFQDPTLKKIHQLYIPLIILGLVIPAAINGVLSGTWMGVLNGFLWGGLVRMFLVHNSTWSNASFSHIFGGRPFESGDRSANNLWCSIPTFGASWQNNHHAFPSSAFLGFKWWQIDLAGYFIRALVAIGLVWNVVGPPSAEMKAAKQVS